eukprot:jgi/Bigna1/75657/fgenesh1_pg.36_\
MAKTKGGKAKVSRSPKKSRDRISSLEKLVLGIDSPENARLKDLERLLILAGKPQNPSKLTMEEMREYAKKHLRNAKATETAALKLTKKRFPDTPDGELAPLYRRSLEAHVAELSRKVSGLTDQYTRAVKSIDEALKVSRDNEQRKRLKRTRSMLQDFLRKSEKVRSEVFSGGEGKSKMLKRALMGAAAAAVAGGAYYGYKQKTQGGSTEAATGVGETDDKKKGFAWVNSVNGEDDGGDSKKEDQIDLGSSTELSSTKN